MFFRNIDIYVPVYMALQHRRPISTRRVVFSLRLELILCSVFFYELAAFGGQWLACLSLHPRFAGSKPAEDDEFLMAIKIRITTSFGGEVKPSTPCRKILRHVK
jgi:hypothetical protein